MGTARGPCRFPAHGETTRPMAALDSPSAAIFLRKSLMSCSDTARLQGWKGMRSGPAG